MIDEELIPIQKLTRTPEFARNGRPAAISTLYRLRIRGKAIPHGNGRRVYLKFTYLPSGAYVSRTDLDAFIAALNGVTGQQKTACHRGSAGTFLDNCGLG